MIEKLLWNFVNKKLEDDNIINTNHLIQKTYWNHNLSNWLNISAIVPV